METRRQFLTYLTGSLSISIAGCNGSTSEVDPSDEVDNWHEDPERATAEPIERESTGVDASDIEEACARKAREVLSSVVSEWVPDKNLESSRLYYGDEKSLPPEHRGRSALFVNRIHYFTRSGRLESAPKIGFETLRSKTPSSVTMNISTQDANHSCEYPVYIDDVVFQEE
ncbi:hypothetical protein ACOJIV_19535 [Haloarcula sp. AONF1]